MITISPDDAATLVTGSLRRCGSWGHFVRISEHLGIKFYFDREMRDNAFHSQAIANDYGLAPKAYSTVDFEFEGRHAYGYLTEAIQFTVNDQMNIMMGNSFSAIEYTQLFERRFGNDKRMLDSKMRRSGLTRFANDLNDGNWGYLDNQPVCIDFS